VIRVLLIVAALAGSAAAHPMLHFDLAGLVRDSEAIVYAERIKLESPSQYSHIDHYRVTRVVKGKLAIGDEVAVEEELYGTDRVKLDKAAVLFLAPQHGKLELVSSGLRVVKDGGVYRFEQWDNPGGWTMVPQGNDPEDIWNAAVTPAGLPVFGHELDAAIARNDAFTAALGIRDRDKRRAALLALFAPPTGDGVSGGFFRDELAQQAEQALVAGGDLAGALLVRERDHTSFRFKLAPASDLVAIARDAMQPADLRAAAVVALGDDMDVIGDADSIHAVIGLLIDADPTVREAAVAVATPHGASSSDPKEQARFRALEREQRTALERRYAVETDPRVLYALVEALDHPPARPSGPPIVARAQGTARGLFVKVRCVRPGARMTDAHVTGGVSVNRIDYECSGTLTGQGGAREATPPGRYPVALEAKVDGKPVTVPLGTAVVAADGTLRVSP
jgi:hypothetical protein